MFKIEKGIPVKRSNKEKTQYPFDKMNDGDSFVFDKEIRNRVANAAHLDGIRFGKKYSIRGIDDGKCRIWRIK